jgi:hypothetical protein
MRIEELKNRLHDIGVDRSEKTLRTWGDRGFITDHQPQLVTTGRGNEEEWPEEAFGEAAAYYQILHRGIVKRKDLPVEKVAEIKQIAERVLLSPKMFREMPSGFAITTAPQFIFDFQALELTAVKDSALNELVVTWIAAKEKAKRNKQISDHVRVVIDWNYDPKCDTQIYSSLIPDLYSASDQGNPMSKALANLKKTMDKPYEVVKAASMMLGRIGSGIDPSEIEKGFTRRRIFVEPSESGSDELVVYLTTKPAGKKRYSKSAWSAKSTSANPSE